MLHRIIKVSRAIMAGIHPTPASSGSLRMRMRNSALPPEAKTLEIAPGFLASEGQPRHVQVSMTSLRSPRVVKQRQAAGSGSAMIYCWNS